MSVEVNCCFCSVQPGQGEGQSQAGPEGLRGGSEVKDEAVARPVVRAGGPGPEEEHHREEAAAPGREVQQRGGEPEPGMEPDQPAQVTEERTKPAALRLSEPAGVQTKTRVT